MVFCLEQGADLHTAQLMPLPLTVSCFSKMQIGQRLSTVVGVQHFDPDLVHIQERVCVCVCVCVCVRACEFLMLLTYYAE